MPEAVFRLRRHRAPRARRAGRAPSRELVQRRSTSARSRPLIVARAPAQNTLPSTDGVLQQALPLRGERVEAGCDQGLHRPWDLDLAVEVAAVCEQTHELLCIERIPPARSNSACCVSDGSTARSSNKKQVGPSPRSLSGARLIVVALRHHPPSPGAARATPAAPYTARAGGTPSAESARCSKNASSAGSAQCRSSNTDHCRLVAANPSRKRRQAVNDSSCSAGSPADRPAGP